jgi:hypothetical protein
VRGGLTSCGSYDNTRRGTRDEPDARATSGTATRYRSSGFGESHPAARPCGDPACSCPTIAPDAGPDPRAGRPADDFDVWFISPAHYRLKRDPENPDVVLGIDLDIPVLRIRPIRRNARPEVDEAVALLRRLLDF